MIEDIRRSDVRFEDALMERKNFGPFVATVLTELRLVTIDLCEEFPVSVRTAEHWIEGEAMPRTNMRAYVIAHLAAMVMESAGE